MNIWLTLLIAGLLTYLIRLSFILLLGKIELPPAFLRALRFVPPAVLSAIIAPELLMHTGQFDLSLGNLRLLSGLLATFVAWRTRNVLISIAAGMALLLILQALVG